ncbi:hypothetical protein, variant 1 [Aphanomyces astaci]|uniref:VPS37 C-terminal domain-containing protein n=2 Tax=Aphanomyces astaci TaxID=112090 RepID=W4H5A4_APHAT|nr:hypothetical protein, variant 1 [Aphanomyces astaci]ETV86323.1 hypothetical protein, variant 1 [Aphanomyces astaci]|eukprot:XP_009824797.1 hypothetical protein, variant 1 [Aphanomyces astaci]
MSWFGKPTSKPAPAANTSAVSELQRLRGRQISSLVRAGGQAINHQQSIFDVVVRLVDSRTLTLRITLPDEFPMQAPIIQTTSRVQHSWLDSQCRVTGHMDLSTWSAHADIGRIVTDIVTEFQRSPPVVIGRGGMSSPSMPPPPITTSASATPMYPGPTSASPLTPSYLQSFPPHATSHQHSQQPPVPSLYPPYPSASTASPSTYGYPAPYASSSAGASYGQGSHQQQPPKPQRDVVRQTQSPAIPTVFPELESLSVNQLEKLVTDRATLKAYIKSMDNVVNFMKLYDDLVKGNRDMAESNLGYEAQLAPLQSDVQSLKQQLHQAQESLHAKQTQQRQALVVCSAIYLVFVEVQAALCVNIAFSSGALGGASRASRRRSGRSVRGNRSAVHEW